MRVMIANQVFVSHTQRDEKFLDDFDRICARVSGIGAFRSEFESIVPPAWRTIKEQMRKSRAMFLLVGRELVASQASLHASEQWKYTQNWIAYEVGLACQLGIDVWVVCDEGVKINFPVPYFNNYLPSSLGLGKSFDYMRDILEDYSRGINFKLGSIDAHRAHCCYDDCRIEFNLHIGLEPGAELVCPQCLRLNVFPEGFL